MSDSVECNRVNRHHPHRMIGWVIVQDWERAKYQDGDKPAYCHSERSEESHSSDTGILRCAQNDT